MNKANKGEKMKKGAQDDSRENKQIEVFHLSGTGGRSNKYLHDAECVVDKKTYKIELKSCASSKNQVSTSRQFSLKKIEEWKRNDCFIFSRWDDSKESVHFIEHVFCTPAMLEPFFKKVAKKLNAGIAGRAGLGDWERAKQVLLENNLHKEAKKLEGTILIGVALNDPRISWKNIKLWGIQINNSEPDKHLRQLLNKHNHKEEK